MKNKPNIFFFNIFLLIGFGVGAWLRLDPHKSNIQNVGAANKITISDEQWMKSNQISSVASDTAKEQNTSTNVLTNQNSTTSLVTDQSPYINPGNESGNVLWITVDQLDSAAPQLLKLWLVIPQDRTKTLHMIPIYPSQGRQNLSNVFRLEGNQLSPEFTNFLNTDHLDWSHFIVVDLNFYHLLSQYLNQPEGGSAISELNPSPEQIEEIWVEADANIIDQVAVINRICGDIFQDDTKARINLSDFLSNSSETYLTNFSGTDILLAQKFIEQKDSLIFCSFPTINQFNP